MLWEVYKQRVPAVEEGHHNCTGARMDNFVVLWRRRIEMFPLLALLFDFGLKMVAPRYISYDDA